MKKNIMVVTGSRAEFGLLQSVLGMLKASSNLEPELIVTGSHLSNEHGLTVNEIREAGFSEFHQIELDLDLTSEYKVGLAVSEAVEKFSQHFSRNKPSLVILLGDRYEIFGVAIACATQGIPIGHIHGGEVTQGSRDEIYRHAITKLASLHFVANMEFYRRVLRLGENPKNVHIVGGLGVDAISNTKGMAKSEIEKSLGFLLSESIAIVTFHPDTNNPHETEKQLESLICAIASFPEIQFIVTGSNADFQGEKVNSIWQSAASDHSNVFFVQSLGQKRYYSLLTHAKMIVGNSSSGLLEAPSFKVATVNIGPRQHGRPRARSVIDVGCDETSIKEAILMAISEKFQKTLATADNPYGIPGASRKILRVLENSDFSALLPKSFFDETIGGV
jgi:UDP-hydrolysing UDP-N-acetyl-D-glucosamine 2-epimerase